MSDVLRCEFFTDEGRGGGLSASKIADYLLQEMAVLSYGGTPYIYCNGRFIENQGEIEREIIRIANDSEHTGSIRALTSEVMHHIVYNDPERSFPFNARPELIPVNNGVLRIVGNQVTLLDHSPEYRFNYIIPHDYDPEADPTIVDEVFRSWADDAYERLLNIPAQALLQAQDLTPFKIGYLLRGEPNTGKTSFLDTLRLFIGDDFVSGLALQDIGVGFNNATLVGKLLNVYDDLEGHDLKNMGRYKSITGGLYHEIERKHKERLNAKIHAVHVFTCNSPPRVKNPDDPAFWNRWEYIIFPNAFEIDPSFPKRVLRAPDFMSGLLKRVVERYIDIKERGIERDPIRVKSTWLYETDPKYAFVKDLFVRDLNADIPKDEVYSRYLDYCEQRDMTPCLKGELSKYLHTCGFVSRRVRREDTRVQVFMGYRFKEEHPPDTSQEGRLKAITERIALLYKKHMAADRGSPSITEVGCEIEDLFDGDLERSIEWFRRACANDWIPYMVIGDIVKRTSPGDASSVK